MTDELRDRDDLHAYLPPPAAAEAPAPRLRWRDAQDRIIAMRFGFYVGVPLFLLLEVLVGRAQAAGRIGAPMALLLSIVVVPCLTGAVIWAWVRVLQGLSAGLVDTISGARGQPATTGFSHEESLVIRGRVQAAADAYALRIAEEGANIEARLRLAALQAGPLAQPDEARATYAAARAAAAPSLAYETAISAALLELFRRQGDRAAIKAELARHARLLPDAPSGRSALARLRAMTREEASEAHAREERPDRGGPG